jgi:hypothetical protein
MLGESEVKVNYIMSVIAKGYIFDSIFAWRGEGYVA